MPSTSLFRSSGMSLRRAAPLALVLALGLSGCGAFGGKGKPATPTVGNRVAILSRVESGAKVDADLANVAVVVPPATANADWPQAGGTASKSYGNLAIAANPQRAWSAKIAGSSKTQRLAASPVIGGGQLFVMDTQGVVHAFDAASGAQHWTRSFEIKGDGSTSVYGGGAAFADGKVYVTTGVGEVAALDAANGNVIWKVKPAGPLRGSPTIAFNAVFVMTQDNQIYSLDIADGAQLWHETAATGQTGVFGVAAPAAASSAKDASGEISPAVRRLAAETGIDPSNLAVLEGVSPSYIVRVLRLAFLSPAVVEAVLDGRLRVGIDSSATRDSLSRSRASPTSSSTPSPNR